jgi:hypothetical protein
MITIFEMMVAIGLGGTFRAVVDVARNWRLVTRAGLANYRSHGAHTRSWNRKRLAGNPTSLRPSWAIDASAIRVPQCEVAKKMTSLTQAPRSRIALAQLFAIARLA